MVLGLGKPKTNLKFFYQNTEIEIVEKFNYLGVIFTKTCNFDSTKKLLADKALKAMYEVLKLGRLFKLSVKILLDLFDKMVKPILLYGCEIWGFGNNESLERVHLKFCKLLLNLKTSTPNYMIYGELGRLPIAIDIKIRMVSYWSKLVNGKQSKLSSILYRLTRQSNENYSIQYSWINCVKTILNDCGFSLIWDSEQFFNNEWLKYIVKQRLTDQFAQNWNSVVFHSTKSINYRIFKTKLEFENYFNVLNFSEAIKLCRFRTTNHHLPIETGRWKNIERENRLCHLCNCNKLGDEYHYMFECIAFTEQR